MARKYEYVRPPARIRNVRRKNPAPALLFLVFLIFFGYLVYQNFYLKPLLREKETNSKFVYYYRELISVSENLASVLYAGPSKKDEIKKIARSTEKIISNLRKDHNELTGNEGKNAALFLRIYEIAINLKLITENPFSIEDYSEKLKKIENELKEVRNSLVRLSLKKEDLDELNKLSFAFDEKKVYRPKPAQTLSNKRRGFAIRSYSMKPKPVQKLDDGTLIIPPADMIEITVEVQNQGEVNEENVSVVLSVSGLSSEEDYMSEQIIEAIKSGEIKPVTFTSIPVNTEIKDAITIEVNIRPVTGEKVLENNKIQLKLEFAPE